MSTFEIEHKPAEYEDRIYVTVDGKFELAIVRTPEGIDIHVYPKDWDYPIDTFTVLDEDVPAAESEVV